MKTRAAIRIQSYWRGVRARRIYKSLRQQRRAAHIIGSACFRFIRSAQIRRQLKSVRQRQLKFFQSKQQQLRENWTYITSNRRVIVHLPSLGFIQSIRENLTDLPLRESYQIGRVCDLEDPNVEVIYVSPVPITEEVLQYYRKLVSDEYIDLSSVHRVNAMLRLIYGRWLNKVPNSFHLPHLATFTIDLPSSFLKHWKAFQ